MEGRESDDPNLAAGLKSELKAGLEADEVLLHSTGTGAIIQIKTQRPPPLETLRDNTNTTSSLTANSSLAISEGEEALIDAPGWGRPLSLEMTPRR